ncbi:hypothetical protein [Aquimarina macrocephali]|uniref:hypothetical protein n=1 Tax=Aquimarina macrocephali TaxID=666563 RepID=UPI003F663FCC
MLENILNLGTLLSKIAQKEIKGGDYGDENEKEICYNRGCTWNEECGCICGGDTEYDEC